MFCNINELRYLDQKTFSTDLFTDFMMDDKEGTDSDAEMIALLDNYRPDISRTNVAQKAPQKTMDASKAWKSGSEATSKKVNSKLADQAITAAKIAEDALEIKINIVKELKQRLRDNKKIIADETNSLHNAQKTANIAFDLLRQANVQLSTLSDAMEAVKINLENAKKTSNNAKKDILEKKEEMKSTRDRIEKIEQQLIGAKLDFVGIKNTAYKAACAAHQAMKKSDRSRRKLQQRHIIRLMHALRPNRNNLE
uniref:Uncharacterized protein n=1 Tax=Glossina brevipalpis TaxID=37001 RepID=A0A1A9WH17_9MUSC